MDRGDLIRQYLKYGWTIVPVVKGTKRPAVNWREFQNTKPSREQLIEWFKDPDVGIGIVTGKGSGVMMIDEDSYKKQGKELHLETPLIVETGGGGKHYYFKYKEGSRNSVNHESAVDVRGEGGFAVLPPTLHPSGKAYKWASELPQDLYDLPTFDDSLISDLLKKHESGVKVNISDYISIPEGGRDDSLLRIALSLVNKHAEADAWILINTVNSTYNPPLADRDVERIFRQALSFVKSNPKKTKDELEKEQAEGLDVMNYADAKAEYEAMLAKYGDGVTTGYRLLDKFFKFIPTQLYMLSASTHVGKTTLALNIAGRVARAGHKVCVASLEQGFFVIPRLATMFGSEEGLRENMTFIAPKEMPSVADFLKTFEAEETRPQLLVVDHLHYFQRGNRGATEEMDKLVTELQMLANKLEIPIITIAHLRKLNSTDKDKLPTMDDLKDSSSLSQMPGVVMLMHRKKNEDEVVQAGGGIFSNKGTLFINKNRVFGETGNLDFTLMDNGEIVFDRDKEDVVNKKAEYSQYATPVQISGLEDLYDDD